MATQRSNQPSDAKSEQSFPQGEQPDFDDDDEAAMDRVYDRLYAGETIDEISNPDAAASSVGDDDEDE